MLHLRFDIATYGTNEWLINGQHVDAGVSEYPDEKTAFAVQSWGSPACPYCKCSLDATDFTDVSDDNTDWHNNRCYVLQFCPRCAYWEFQGFEGGNKCMDPNQTILASSVAAKFSSKLPDGCSEELAQQLRRHPMFWHDVPPVRMETLVADIFRANHPHCEVIHVGAPGDRGVDVVFIDNDGTKWLIQVKRRSRPHKAEGFSTLQSILGTLTLEGERHGMIVSTADYVSHQAKREHQRARQRGYIVELVDKGVLDRMIGALLPRTPWRGLFAHPSLNHISDDVRQYFLHSGIDAQLTLF